jgi:YhcH/YjgK/YiaL family protein
MFIQKSCLKVSSEITSYDNSKDIIFLSAEQNNYRIATPERFFVFFPDDAHRPCVRIDENSIVRKIVVKIRVN